MHVIYSVHIVDTINLKDAKSKINGKLLNETISELFYDMGGKLLAIYNYGAISFANYDKSSSDEIVKLVKSISEDTDEYNVTDEEIKIDVYNTETEEEEKYGKFSFEDNILYVPEKMFVDKNMFRIVMFNLSQTVTMDYYSSIGDSLLNNTKKLTKELELKGKIDISKSEMMKFIGKSLNAKTNVVDTLYIFDSPDLTWENPDIDELHKFLVYEFDLKSRFRELEYSFKIVDDNLQTFKDIYQHKESYVMETIVIILILIEVIKSFTE